MHLIFMEIIREFVVYGLTYFTMLFEIPITTHNLFSRIAWNSKKKTLKYLNTLTKKNMKNLMMVIITKNPMLNKREI